jgi:transcriptional regulator with XRE-family HTH domain
MISESTKLILAVMSLKKISRAELATRMGRSRSYVTQLLNGNTNMTLSTLERLMKALEVEFHLVWIDKST